MIEWDGDIFIEYVGGAGSVGGITSVCPAINLKLNVNIWSWQVSKASGCTQFIRMVRPCETVDFFQRHFYLLAITWWCLVSFANSNNMQEVGFSSTIDMYLNNVFWFPECVWFINYFDFFQKIFKYF